MKTSTSPRGWIQTQETLLRRQSHYRWGDKVGIGTTSPHHHHPHPIDGNDRQTQNNSHWDTSRYLGWDKCSGGTRVKGAWDLFVTSQKLRGNNSLLSVSFFCLKRIEYANKSHVGEIMGCYTEARTVTLFFVCFVYVAFTVFLYTAWYAKS